eukprot:Rmarinus@m.19250
MKPPGKLDFTAYQEYHHYAHNRPPWDGRKGVLEDYDAMSDPAAVLHYRRLQDRCKVEKIRQRKFRKEDKKLRQRFKREEALAQKFREMNSRLAVREPPHRSIIPVRNVESWGPAVVGMNPEDTLTDEEVVRRANLRRLDHKAAHLFAKQHMSKEESTYNARVTRLNKQVDSVVAFAQSANVAWLYKKAQRAASVAPGTIPDRETIRARFASMHAAASGGTSDDGGLWRIQRGSRGTWAPLVREVKGVFAIAANEFPQDVLSAVLRGDSALAMGLKRAPLLCVMSSTWTDFVGETTVLFHDVFPFLRMICTLLGIHFMPPATIDFDPTYAQRPTTASNATSEGGVGTSSQEPVARQSSVSSLSQASGEDPDCDDESAGAKGVTAGCFERSERRVATLAELMAKELNNSCLLASYGAISYGVFLGNKLGSEAMRLSMDTRVIDLMKDGKADAHMIPFVVVREISGVNEPDAGQNASLYVDYTASGSVDPRARKVIKKFLTAFSDVLDPSRIKAFPPLSWESPQRPSTSQTVQRETSGSLASRPMSPERSDLFASLDSVTEDGGMSDFTGHARRRESLSRVSGGGPEAKAHVKLMRAVADAVCETLATTAVQVANTRHSAAIAAALDVDPVLQEAATNLAYASVLSERFVDTDSAVHVFTSVSQYLTNIDADFPLFIHGEEGVGRTATAAQLSLLLSSGGAFAHPSGASYNSLFRFVGITATSRSGPQLLYGMLRHVSRMFGGGDWGLPLDTPRLVEEFPRALSCASEDYPLCLVVDDADALEFIGPSGTPILSSTSWIPPVLPPHAKLICTLSSTANGVATLHNLKRFFPEQAFVELTPVHKDDAAKLLNSFLSASNKSRDSAGMANLFLKTAPQPYLPLKLCVSGAALSVRGTVRQLLCNLLWSFSGNVGLPLVKHALGSLAASRSGLTITEVEEVLSLHPPVWEGLVRQWADPKCRSDVGGLVPTPALLWRKLRSELGALVVEVVIDGGWSVFQLFHMQLVEVVQEELMQNRPRPFHRVLARYFSGGTWEENQWKHVPEGSPPPSTTPYSVPLEHPLVWTDIAEESSDVPPVGARAGGPSEAPLDGQHASPSPARGSTRHAATLGSVRRGPVRINLRKLTELPYQQIKAHLWGELRSTLCNLRFVEAMCRGGRLLDILELYRVANREMASVLVKSGGVSNNLPYLSAKEGIADKKDGSGAPPQAESTGDGPGDDVDSWLSDVVPGTERTDVLECATATAVVGRVQSFERFVTGNMSVLAAAPHLIMQLAMMEDTSSVVYDAVHRRVGGMERVCLTHSNPPPPFPFVILPAGPLGFLREQRRARVPRTMVVDPSTSEKAGARRQGFVTSRSRLALRVMERFFFHADGARCIWMADTLGPAPVFAAGGVAAPRPPEPKDDDSASQSLEPTSRKGESEEGDSSRSSSEPQRSQPSSRNAETEDPENGAPPPVPVRESHDSVAENVEKKEASGSVVLWCGTGEIVQRTTPRGPVSAVSVMCGAARDVYVSVGFVSGQAELWELRPGGFEDGDGGDNDVIVSLEGDGSAVLCVAVNASGDSTGLAALTSRGQYTSSAKTGAEKTFHLLDSTDACERVCGAISVDGEIVCFGSESGLCVLKTKSGKQVRVDEERTRGMTSVGISAESSVICVLSAGTVYVYQHENTQWMKKATVAASLVFNDVSLVACGVVNRDVLFLAVGAGAHVGVWRSSDWNFSLHDVVVAECMSPVQGLQMSIEQAQAVNHLDERTGDAGPMSTCTPAVPRVLAACEGGCTSILEVTAKDQRYVTSDDDDVVSSLNNMRDSSLATVRMALLRMLHSDPLSVRLLTFPAGRVLFSEGEALPLTFVVVDGSFEVYARRQASTSLSRRDITTSKSDLSVGPTKSELDVHRNTSGENTVDNRRYSVAAESISDSLPTASSDFPRSDAASGMDSDSDETSKPAHDGRRCGKDNRKSKESLLRHWFESRCDASFLFSKSILEQTKLGEAVPYSLVGLFEPCAPYTAVSSPGGCRVLVFSRETFNEALLSHANAIAPGGLGGDAIRSELKKRLRVTVDHQFTILESVERESMTWRLKSVIRNASEIADIHIPMTAHAAIARATLLLLAVPDATHVTRVRALTDKAAWIELTGAVTYARFPDNVARGITLLTEQTYSYFLEYFKAVVPATIQKGPPFLIVLLKWMQDAIAMIDTSRKHPGFRMACGIDGRSLVPIFTRRVLHVTVDPSGTLASVVFGFAGAVGSVGAVVTAFSEEQRARCFETVVFDTRTWVALHRFPGASCAALLPSQPQLTQKQPHGARGTNLSNLFLVADPFVVVVGQKVLELPTGRVLAILRSPSWARAELWGVWTGNVPVVAVALWDGKALGVYDTHQIVRKNPEDLLATDVKPAFHFNASVAAGGVEGAIFSAVAVATPLESVSIAGACMVGVSAVECVVVAAALWIPAKCRTSSVVIYQGRKLLTAIDYESEEVTSVAVHCSGHYVAVGTSTRTVHIYAPTSPTPLRTLNGCCGSISALTFITTPTPSPSVRGSADGSPAQAIPWVVCGSDTGWVEIYGGFVKPPSDRRHGRTSAAPRAHATSVSAMHGAVGGNLEENSYLLAQAPLSDSCTSVAVTSEYIFCGTLAGVLDTYHRVRLSK